MLIDALKWIGSAIVAVLAPFLVIIVGALMVGAGIYQGWQWLTYAGIFLAVLGLAWISYHWLGAD